MGGTAAERIKKKEEYTSYLFEPQANSRIHHEAEFRNKKKIIKSSLNTGMSPGCFGPI